MAYVQPPVLVCPDAFAGTLRAAEVAAAVARGLERAGLAPPDRCPVAGGGPGTLEILLAALGGETAGAPATDALGRPVRAGFALVEDGGTAIVEVAETAGPRRVAAGDHDPATATSRGTGELIAAAAAAGAQVVLVAAGGGSAADGGAGAIEAIAEAGGLQGTALVVLCDERRPFEHAARAAGADRAATTRLQRRLDRRAARWPKDPRGVPMTGAGGGLAGGLWAALGARLEPGTAFVVQALDVDRRIRAARAVVIGEGRLDRATLLGGPAGEIATRARQAGVPCHAIVGADAIEPFDARILDLQVILEAGTPAALQDAGERLGRMLEARVA
ncbi:glycerate kinase [Baekduia soli]|uniref:Glycerate kinase n=1 Tax=Baekduia soli TaxID=496014 RepID=A0A5B8U027_9ACTN|nr:glycerate kinase [Baekduia soli]QEC46322.1 glycerate kinase [Baekduia soli]